MEYVKKMPAECLSDREAAGVWSGWSIYGDREVVREASAKGTHVELAHKCLAYRRRCTISDAQKYFLDEVEIWVDEILQKQQIHRASHILQNAGKIPLQFIREKCVKCKDPKLRQYLANYVVANGGFEGEHEASWNIMNSITLFQEKNGSEISLIEDRCIQEIGYISDAVKSALITDLYFNIQESSLVDKLKNTFVWDYLLANNKVADISRWIETYFCKVNEGIDPMDMNDAIPNAKDIFHELEIVDEMIERVETSDAAYSTKELILNKLCRHGSLTKKEGGDVKLILSRLFSAGKAPSEFPTLFSKECFHVDRQGFEKKIFSILHHPHETSIENSSLEDRELPEKKVLAHLRTICDTKRNEKSHNRKIFHRAIVESIETILTRNVNDYFRENPLILLTLIFLEASSEESEKTTNIQEIFNNGTGNGNSMKIGDSSMEVSPQVLQETLEKCVYLQKFISEKNSHETVPTCYELLENYDNFDSRRFYEWRTQGDSMPTFACEKLSKKYGIEEKLSLMHYLKEARPCMAAYTLRRKLKKNQENSKLKYRAAAYAHRFALQQSENTEIMCSCVAFIELLEVDSECLRLYSTAGEYVKKSLNVSIYDLLENISTKKSTNNEPNDQSAVLNHLERSFLATAIAQNQKSFLNEPEKFVEALKAWDFIMKFAKWHNMPEPCEFIKYLAGQNAWFEFVLVCHVFAYPLDFIRESCRDFLDPCIREHVTLSLTNSHILTANNRENNAARIKSREIGQNSTRPAEMGNWTENEKAEPETDLWLVILTCHQSQDPPRALLTAAQTLNSPILIILAACYEPSAISAYCYAWLVVSSRLDLPSYRSCLSDQLWSARSVLDLFCDILELQYVETIFRAFQIFLPKNALCSFFEFLVGFVDRSETKESKDKFRRFLNDCSGLMSNRAIDWSSVDTDYLQNSYWIVTVALQCMMIVLDKCLKSTHLQLKFLDIPIKCHFNDLIIHEQTPNFVVLWKTVRILGDTNVRFDFSSIRVYDEKANVNNEIERCISRLTANEDFHSALELSKVAEFKCSAIIIAQYRSEFKRCTNNGEKVEATFWTRCASDLTKYGVSFQDAATFFVEHAEKVVSHKERYEILKLALVTLEPIFTEKRMIDQVEMAMWKSCILAGPDSIEIDDESGVFNKLKSELLSSMSDLQVSCTLNDKTEEAAVESIVNRFVAAGKLGIALRITAIFNYKHRDLQILMLCLSLAEGEISPYQLTSQQKSLLTESENVKQSKKYTTLRNRGFQRRSSVSSLSSSIVNVSIDVGDTTSSSIQQIQLKSLSLIDKLVKGLQSGYATGQRIFFCVKLATYLRRSYQSLLTLEDPMQLLYEVVGSTCDRKLEMVGDIIAAYRIKNQMVAEFLAEEIVANTPRLVEEGLENSIVMWGYPLGVSIQAIIDFCNDPSLLGWELFKTANLSLGHSHGAKRNVLTLKVAVELLIRSHDCFTASCSMEGIASILRKSQHLAYTLQQLKHWSLLVRLVTGLGRFTEMNYVFQILLENDQFEFLLGQGLDNIPGLKTALLEFCKRQCSGNKELFTLIALHFRLYTEIAVKWENEARDIINELVAEGRKNGQKSLTGQQQISVKLTRNESIEQKLQVIIENFTHATEYYVQDNKLNLANRCSHQAQLAALQLYLLSVVEQNQQANCLFNLSPEEINRTMCQTLSLPQTLILVQAYNHHGDWSSAVYSRVVINGETRYLRDLLASNRLTLAIVQDCVCRYRSEKTITKQMMENMEMLVAELNEIECKYVLASQLGFKSIIERILANPSSGSFLKDTVWKQGFNIKEFFMDDNYRA